MVGKKGIVLQTFSVIVGCLKLVDLALDPPFFNQYNFHPLAQYNFQALPSR